jgi:hypothetical protein
VTSEDATPGPGRSRLRYFVRRVPDVTTRWRRRRSCYEVGTFPEDSSIPLAVERTTSPGSVLLHAGLHTTDIADHLHNADAAWTGGTGPWRGMWPDRDPSWSDDAHTEPGDSAQV